MTARRAPHLRLALLALLAGAVLVGCEALPRDAAEHPLAERIVRSADGATLDPDTLFDVAADAQVVLLGEKHDNQRHHDLQLRVLQELVARGKRPAIGFEVFDIGQTSLLMGYAAGKSFPHAAADPESQLRATLGWQDDGPRWQGYGPLLRFAREQGLTVFGADLPVALRRRIASVGIAGLSGAERSLLPDTPDPDVTYAALMRERIREAHCGYGSDEYLDRLLENWTVRNETMVRAIAAARDGGDGEPVVLIVGWAHLRHDRGVPARLARLAPDARQANVGFRELSVARTQVTDYTAPLDYQGATFAPDHPYLWFTPPTERVSADRCAAFRKAGHRRQGEEKKKE